MNIFQKIVFYISSFVLAVAPLSKYTEGVVGQPRSFLPSQAVTQTDKTISSLIYRGLFKYDIWGNLLPDLAESWTISEDGLVYTIKLKGAQKWSDGTTISSDDLIYTAFKMADLSGVATDRVDDLTVRYTLPNKYSPFLSVLTSGVMQQNSEENYNPLTPVSNGQFRVLRVERNGPAIKQVVLLNTEKNPKITKLIFKYYPSDEELLTAAKLGEVDGFLSNKNVNIENFAEYQYPLHSVYYALFFNLRNEKFNDVELRRKLEKVLNIKDLVYGKGINVEGAISRSMYTDKNITFDKYDKKFNEDISNLKLSIKVPKIKAQRDLAEQIKAIWEDKLDIKVEVNEIDPSEFAEKVINSRDFEVALYGQEIGRDPDRYVNWHSTQKDAPGLNISGFEQVRADRALEEGRNEIDNEKRIVHYNEFQKVIEDQVPAIFLYHPFVKYYVTKYFEGIGEKYTFTPTDRFLDFNNWKRINTN